MDVFEQAAARFERVPEGEAEQIAEIARLIVTLLEQRYGEGGRPILRAVHPKAHACAEASFRVDPDLPEHLRVGLFAEPGATYEAVIRFSNAAALVGPDIAEAVADGKTTRSHGSRGMAIKVRGVPGEAFLSCDESGSQDFLMVNAPVFPFANVADYLALTRAQVTHRDESRAVLGAFAQAVAQTPGGPQRARRAAEIAAAIQQAPMTSPLAGSYFTAAPFLFGPDRAAKFAAVPVDPPAGELPDPLSSDYLRDVLVRQIGGKAAAFDLRVQLKTAEDGPVIEDVAAEWDAASTPFETLGRVTIPAQDCGSEGAVAACERLFFTPWHALPEHRPLGGINRLRKAAYEASFERRTSSGGELRMSERG